VNGVPIVIAPPFFADKRDIAARVEWSGTGVNLPTETPSEEELREGVLRVLQEEGSRKRAVEVKGEIEGFDIMAIIAGAIDEGCCAVR
jgi:UDP:flavonoid glycosyltransferase YjiC (YdhE family)